MTSHPSYDLIIVGSGLMGAAVARGVRDEHPRARIAMVDGGPPLGSTLGQHLHDVPEPEIWGEYNEKVSSGIQGFYTGTTPTAPVGADMARARPGMYHLDSLGEDSTEMPSAAVAWNVGGMGIHWTAATPTPWGSEIPPDIPAHEWRQDLARATEILRINRDPYEPTPGGRAVTRALEPDFGSMGGDGRGIQPMPMAINPTGSGLKERTGPQLIFAPIGDLEADPWFTLVPGTLAVAIVHQSGRASGVTVRDMETGQVRTLEADQVIVCADAIRTPQLLFASGIRPPALGRYLNEHAFVTGRVLVDPERLGFDLAAMNPPSDHEWAADCLWIPHRGPSRPFQVHLMNSVMVDEERAPLAYAVGLEVYVPTEIRRENAVEFSQTETDATGMPRISIRFDYSDRDRDLIDQARGVQRTMAQLLGEFDPDTESALLPPGSSLHFTGTVRMGLVDDGTSVSNIDGKVWGFDNVYVAGNGVIPTALACNSTLTGMTTAVRAARAISAGVGGAAVAGAGAVR